MRFPKSYGYQPADLIVIAYASLCVVGAIVGVARIPNGPAWLAAASGVLLLAYLSRFVPPDAPGLLRFLRDSYVVWVLPGAYASAGAINRAFTSRYFDDTVLAWEVALFGGHPHTRLAELLPFPVLSELLHLSYYVYLWLVPILGFALVLGGRRREFRIMVTTVGLTFYSCYAFFIFFPVLGPYYTFEPVAVPGAFFVQLVHRTLESGSALGTAFPSSHCAVAIVVTVCAWRYAWKPLAIAITVVTVGIVIGTMYGGFHYAIDTIVGVLVGTGFAAIGPSVHRRLSRIGGWSEPPQSGTPARAPSPSPSPSPAPVLSPSSAPSRAPERDGYRSGTGHRSGRPPERVGHRSGSGIGAGRAPERDGRRSGTAAGAGRAPERDGHRAGPPAAADTVSARFRSRLTGRNQRRSWSSRVHSLSSSEG